MFFKLVMDESKNYVSTQFKKNWLRVEHANIVKKVLEI